MNTSAPCAAPEGRPSESVTGLSQPCHYLVIGDCCSSQKLSVACNNLGAVVVFSLVLLHTWSKQTKQENWSLLEEELTQKVSMSFRSDMFPLWQESRLCYWLLTEGEILSERDRHLRQCPHLLCAPIWVYVTKWTFQLLGSPECLKASTRS